MSDVQGGEGSPESTNTEVQPQQGGEAQAKVEAAKQAATEVRKFKLKVDGVEEELDEETFRSWAQKGKAADKRMSEAAQMRKQSEEFARLLKTDPVKLLTDPRIGLNFDELAEKYLYEKYQYEGLSEQEKEAVENKKQLAKYKQQEEEEKARRQEELDAAETKKYVEQFDKQFVEALQKAELPKTPASIKRMTEYMRMSIKQGIEVTPMDVADLVKQDIREDLKSVMSSADAKTIIDLLGEEIVTKIRKHDLSRVSSPNFVKSTAPSKVASGAPPKGQRTLTKEEWKEKLRRDMED